MLPSFATPGLMYVCMKSKSKLVHVVPSRFKWWVKSTAQRTTYYKRKLCLCTMACKRYPRIKTTMTGKPQWTLLFLGYILWCRHSRQNVYWASNSNIVDKQTYVISVEKRPKQTILLVSRLSQKHVVIGTERWKDE